MDTEEDETEQDGTEGDKTEEGKTEGDDAQQDDTEQEEIEQDEPPSSPDAGTSTENPITGCMYTHVISSCWHACVYAPLLCTHRYVLLQTIHPSLTYCK